jgi:hypothetical protein
MKQHKYHNSDEIIGVRVDAAFAWLVSKHKFLSQLMHISSYYLNFVYSFP